MHLNTIAPNGPAGSDLRFKVKPSRASCLCRSVLLVWDRVKISRAGEYSTKRTHELEQYCQNAPLRRVFAVCALTPCAALLLGILTECVPLQDPSAGWNANIGAWIRFWVFICSAAFGFLFQIRGVAPELSYRKILLITMGTGCGTIMVLIVLAALWAFPLPFGIVLISIPFQVFFVTFVLISIGGVVNAALKQKIYLILAQSALVFVYVTFSVVFTKCTRQQQFGLLLFLPVMKLFFKHLIARLASEDSETIPVVVVFTVDLFNGLYISICLQSSRSWWTSSLMIVLNVCQTLIALWEIARHAKALEVLTESARFESLSHVIGGNNTLETNRLRSVSLFRTTIFKNQIVPSELNFPTKLPVDLATPAPTPRSSGSKLARTASALDRSSRKMLFRLEYLVLIEYIESVIPTVYVIYLTIVYALPSAKYYPHTRNLTPEELRTNVGSIMMYASAEMLSLVWLHVVLKRRFGFSLLYQLAFVLETRVELVQGRLFVWIMPLLQITLVHFGLDFSFQFKWLQTNMST